MYIRVYVCECMSMYASVCTHVCVYAQGCVSCMHEHVLVVHVHTHVCVHIAMHMCVFV